MKIFIATILLTLSFMVKSYAGELLAVNDVIKQGHVVLMGELTGAGSRVSLKNLHGLVLPEGVLLKTECTGIVVKNSADPKVSDIVKIKIGDAEISANEFVGLVIN